MQNLSVTSKTLNLLQLILQVNFNAAVITLLISGVATILGNSLFFADNSDLYGPLANNMRLMMFYLCLIQVAVYSFYKLDHRPEALAALGIFLLLLIAALEFYCSINQIDVDDNYRQLLLYSGLSHLLYGGCAALRDPQHRS
ncbi:MULTISPECIES: hypothetical protein [Methylomonas]|uniref:Uncharacterized protein n=1 Tax=Methylomonas koyamae TaxID=702114 RepID=A0A177PJT5_9GAMM|nr:MULTISPECIES: hypothetical protein [Methylomonas]ANE55692.1 hypothetical protein AYM39_11220 [Methylomonas sp. DH-1]ATG90543.1 hypothetical protein MKLM6_2320 [Methylomonas koyamae]OAI16192.1 hypothetical protein A1507_12335 [Methylomonas koyamae]OAI30054.1 hypothetical protein A1356_22450 [Methylomonas koyamae]WNB73853.1 hypothetical protein RI210_11190 [Methylomonas koyamae]